MADEVKKMTDLSSLNGISDARSELYNRLAAGEIPEAKAVAMERILRGQESLKAHVPIRLLSIITRWKGTQAEKFVTPLVENLLTFTTKSLSSGSEKK